MQAYTDASVGDNYSIHSYVLYNNGEVTLQNCTTRNENDVQKAELTSILLLLKKCNEKQLKNIVIHTDSQSITRTSIQHKLYGSMIKEMNDILEVTGSSLIWVGRKSNKAAHNICKSIRRKLELANLKGTTNQFNISEFVILRDERKFSEGFRMGAVGSHSTEIVKSHIKAYYDSLIKCDKRKPIEDILSWGDNERNCKSARGRRLFVERYIERHHVLSDIHFNNAKHVFNKVITDNLVAI